MSPWRWRAPPSGAIFRRAITNPVSECGGEYVLSEKAPRSPEDGKQTPSPGSQAPSPSVALKPLREWSGRRLTAVALSWLVGIPLLAAPAIFGAVGWLARAERDRQVSAAADSVAPGLRVAYLPPQGSDFTISVMSSELGVTTLLFLLPPVALCLAWLAARRRRPAT